MFSAWKGSDGQIHFGDFPESIRTIPPSEGLRMARELLGAYAQWQGDSASVTATIATEHELKMNLKTDGVRAVGKANLPSKSGEEWDLDPESPLPEGVSIVTPKDPKASYCLSMDLSKQPEELQWSAGPLPDFMVVCRARKSGKEAISLHRLRVQPVMCFDLAMFRERVVGQLRDLVRNLRALPGLEPYEMEKRFARAVAAAGTLDEWSKAASATLLEPIASSLLVYYHTRTMVLPAGARPDRLGCDRIYDLIKGSLEELASWLQQPLPRLPRLDGPISANVVIADGGAARVPTTRLSADQEKMVFWVMLRTRDKPEAVAERPQVIVW